MKKSFVLIVMTLLSISNTTMFCQDTGTLILKVNDFKNSKGFLFVKLFAGEEGFPSNAEKAFRTKEVKIVNNQVSVAFDNIPFGTYALSSYHDENANHKLDKYIFGMPKESAAASNNAKGNMGPPNYDDAKFVFDTDGQYHIISMHRH